MQHPAASRHAAGGDDHLGVAVGRQRLGFLDVAHVGDGRAGGFVFARGQLVFAGVAVQQFSGARRHRAVEVHRDIPQPAGLAQLPQCVDQGLRAAHGEGGDHDSAAALHGAVDDGAQRFDGIGGVVAPVAVGGLNDDVIGSRNGFGVVHDRVAVAAEVAGEDHAHSAHVDLRGGRAKNVPGAAQGQFRAAGQGGRLVQGDVRKAPHRPFGVDNTVERQRRRMLGEALAVGEFGILLLQIGAVQQDQFRDVAGCGGGMDAALESVCHQPRQVAAVIQMGMGQHDRVDVGGRDGQALPVELAQVLQALEQPAVDQQAGVSVAQQVLGSGDGAGAAKAGQ
ncbi:hypothetical protein D9M70_479970 [compost metagenome]